MTRFSTANRQRCRWGGWKSGGWQWLLGSWICLEVSLRFPWQVASVAPPVTDQGDKYSAAMAALQPGSLVLISLFFFLVVVSFGDFAGCSINNIEQNINTLQKSHLASPINCGGSEERKTVTALPLTWSNDKLREDRLRRRLVVTHIRMRADETTSCLE